jgi:hypothetical protein
MEAASLQPYEKLSSLKPFDAGRASFFQKTFNLSDLLSFTSFLTMAASTQSKYVTLISSDGFEFVVLREAACTAGAIRKMLDTTSLFTPL